MFNIHFVNFFDDRFHSRIGKVLSTEYTDKQCHFIGQMAPSKWVELHLSNRIGQAMHSHHPNLIEAVFTCCEFQRAIQRTKHVFCAGRSDDLLRCGSDVWLRIPGFFGWHGDDCAFNHARFKCLYKKSACNTAILRIFLEHLVSRLHRHYVEVFTKNHLLHPHETLLDHFKGRLKAPRTLCIARPASYAELLVDVWAPVFHVNRPRWARHGAGTTTDAQSVPMIFVNRSQPHAYPASMERGLRYSKSPPIAASIVLAITSGPVGHPGSAKSTLTRLATGRNDSCEGVAACPPTLNRVTQPELAQPPIATKNVEFCRIFRMSSTCLWSCRQIEP